MTVPREIAKQVKRLRVVKDKYDELKIETAALYKEKEKLENVTLPQLMEDAELDKASIVGAGSITIKPDVFAYVNKDDQPEFQDWLRRNNHASLIKETVHHASLRSWVKEMLENGQELPTDTLKFTPFNKAAFRRN